MERELGATAVVALNLADTWSACVAPRIVRYVQRVNADYYAHALAGRSLDEANAVSTAALNFVPFLVRRLHRETNTKLSYLIASVEVSGG